MIPADAETREIADALRALGGPDTDAPLNAAGLLEQVLEIDLGDPPIETLQEALEALLEDDEAEAREVLKRWIMPNYQEREIAEARERAEWRASLVPTVYLGNAFSLGMIDLDHAELDIRRVELADVPRQGWESCVGHADTALLLSAMLGVDVPMRRVTTSLVDGDVIYVAQYTGPRLPEGATALPEGAKIRWYRAEVQR